MVLLGLSIFLSKSKRPTAHYVHYGYLLITVKLAHGGHHGICKTKAFLKNKVWFPNIETFVSIRNERLREKVTMKLKKINDLAKEKEKMTELIRYAQVAENSFIDKTAHRILRRNYSSDNSGK